MSGEADRRALRLAAFIGGAGLMHFIRPQFFDAVVPHWMPGRPRTTTYVSGAVELVGATLLLPRRTRRVGGWWCAATFLGVYPANIQGVVEGGHRNLDPPLGSAFAAWARLPLQFPMVWTAVRVAREAGPSRASA